MAAIAAAVTLYSGCFLVVLGDNQSAYVFGELNTTVARSVAAVDQAANLSLEQSHYAKISQANSLVDAKIVARLNPESNITVLIERTGAERARLRIRAGALGDEALSRRLMEKIKANL